MQPSLQNETLAFMSLQPPDMFLQWVSYHIHIACLWCEFHIRRWGGWKVKFNPITRINVGKTCFFEATDKLKCHGSFFCNPTFFFNCQFKYFCLSLFFFKKRFGKDHVLASKCLFLVTWLMCWGLKKKHPFMSPHTWLDSFQGLIGNTEFCHNNFICWWPDFLSNISVLCHHKYVGTLSSGVIYNAGNHFGLRVLRSGANQWSCLSQRLLGEVEVRTVAGKSSSSTPNWE